LKVFRFATARGNTVSEFGFQETTNLEEARLLMGKGIDRKKLHQTTDAN